VTKLAAPHVVGLIEPEDIANRAMFLVSEESRMVTGHVYPADDFVNGGPDAPHIDKGAERGDVRHDTFKSFGSSSFSTPSRKFAVL
jgi:hypothetical protein